MIRRIVPAELHRRMRLEVDEMSRRGTRLDAEDFSDFVEMVRQAAENQTTAAEGAYTPVNPKHYRSHPSGIECIMITERMEFLKGNAFKYIWRAGEKGDEVEDLEKAIWYLRRRISLVKRDRGDELEAFDCTVGRGLRDVFHLEKRWEAICRIFKKAYEVVRK